MWYLSGICYGASMLHREEQQQRYERWKLVFAFRLLSSDSAVSMTTKIQCLGSFFENCVYPRMKGPIIQAVDSYDVGCFSSTPNFDSCSLYCMKYDDCISNSFLPSTVACQAPCSCEFSTSVNSTITSIGANSCISSSHINSTVHCNVNDSCNGATFVGSIVQCSACHTDHVARIM